MIKKRFFLEEIYKCSRTFTIILNQYFTY